MAYNVNDNVNIEVVSNDTFSLGENPNWLPKSKTLMQVDVFGQNLVHLNPVTKQSKTAHIGPNLTFALPCTSAPENAVILSKRKEILKYEWDTGKTQVLVEMDEGNPDSKIIFNDAKCDAKGRLWAGTVGFEPPFTALEKMGALYSYDGKKMTKHVSNVTTSNGLDWSIDNKTFYYVDSSINTLDAFDFDLEAGQLSNRRTVFNYKNHGTSGFLDGLCVDNNDNLWVVCYNGSEILNIDPKTDTTRSH